MIPVASHEAVIRTRRASHTMAWRTANPDKFQAQCMARAAIKSGELRRLPCQICGSTKRIHAHHEDYTAPLVVRWHCNSCHTKLHRLGLAEMADSPRAVRGRVVFFPSPDDRLDVEAALAKVNRRDRFVIQCRMNGCTLAETGTALGGMTRERVRQIEERGMARLRSLFSLSPSTSGAKAHV